MIGHHQVHQHRGVSHGRLRAHRLLVLFVGGFGLILVAGTAAAGLMAPRQTAECQSARLCGVTPRTPQPLVSNTRWRSLHFGYSVEYPGNEASVAAQDGEGMMLQSKLQDGSTGIILIQAAGSNVSPAQAIKAQVGSLQGVSQVALNSNPAAQLLGSSVGYVAGVGGTYTGDLAAPQGVGQPVSIASEAAGHGSLTVTATVVAPVRDSGASSFLYQLADQVINSVTWPGAVHGAAVAEVLPRGGATDPHAALLGATDPHAMLSFSLVLRMPGAQRLHHFVQALYDPASPSYHRFIDARSFGERFGVTGRALHAARVALVRDGLQVTAAFPQRTALEVRGTAGTVQRVFGARMLDYAGTGGGRFHAPSGRLTIPANLRAAVSAVAGLNSGNQEIADDVPGIGLTPAVARAAYDINPLYGLEDKAQNERIALVALANYKQPDLDAFDRQFGLPALTPVVVPVDGGSGDDNQGDESETEVDLEVMHEIAPEAQLLVYSAPQANQSGADSLADVIDRIVADGRADIVSDSWGGCELNAARPDIQLDEQALDAAIAHGVSIFKSAGDSGAYECQDFNSSDHRLSVEWPSSSPDVITVGGTALSVDTDGAYAGETTWEDPLENSGGGGGLSAYFARPSWQQGPGVSNGFSDGRRQLPDVSADADVASGWATYTAGSGGQTGGTSAAAPFWAASMALIEQYAHGEGVAHLGFVDPMLYALAASSQPYPPFHDITVGTNRYYPATPGWDFATGLGSPDVYNLARDVVRYMRAH